ncbi:MAG: PleD family two-component system response regulator [Desulfamplus sp.]|nr:PleD family two-component system response regulator [Desulfamplus sp.]MBF0411684.1 PleD family two-component system response regulator [Desulfamplus sp.]
METNCIKSSILIVDDEPYNLKILNELLRTDYSIRVATNGERALEIVMSDNPPDLVLLDVIMPGIDGYEVCQRLKADTNTHDIPVIFITSKTDERDEIRGFETGAVDYVTKPFRPIVVQARVRTHIDLKRKSKLLENQSLRDGLTGVSNRRRFNEYIEIAWNCACRDSSPLSIIIIDIDHFKLYNDTYGHQEGDSCLITVANTLESLIRRKIDLLARYGGEEFCCILPKTESDGACNVALQFQNKIIDLKIPHIASSTHSCVSISQGVATVVPSQDSSPEELIKMADEALYKAKNSGRNRFCTY